MVNFKKEQKRANKRIYNPKDIYLLTTNIVCNYNDGTGNGPKSITQYYLATKKKEKFAELFSGVIIDLKDKSISNCAILYFDVPTLVKAEPLEKHVKFFNKKLNAYELLYFITKMNMEEFCKILD